MFRQRLFVDGTEVRNDIVDTNGGACGAEFYVPVPCRTAAGPGSLDLDTSTLTDGTHSLRFEVRDATDTNKVEISPWTITVDNLPPTIGAVEVSGTAREGETLTCGAAPAGQSATVTYAWLQSASDGSAKSVIAGATATTYVLRAADVGRKIICRVTAADGGGTSTQESSITSGPFAGGATVASAPAPAGSQSQTGTTPSTQPTQPSTTTTPSSSSSQPATTAPEGSTGNPGTPTGSNGAPGAAGAPGGAGGTGGNGSAGGDLNTVPGVTNPSPAGQSNGHPASDDARLSVKFVIGAGAHARTSTRVVAAYAQRLSVRGELRTAAGLPIANARVFLAQKAPGAPDSAWRSGRSAVTAGDGGFSVPLAQGGTNREIRVVYFPHGDSSVNRGSNILTLQVRQDATLRLSRRMLHNGGSLRFDGRVLGTVPSTGVDVRVQVQVGRSWFTFAKMTTSRAKGGRFRTSHRFTKTTRPVTYRFRVLVLPRNRISYAKGFSRHVTVRVLP